MKCDCPCPCLRIRSVSLALGMGGWAVGRLAPAIKQPVSALYPDAVGARCSPGLALWENSALCSAPSSDLCEALCAPIHARALSLPDLSLLADAALLAARCSLSAALYCSALRSLYTA